MFARRVVSTPVHIHFLMPLSCYFVGAPRVDFLIHGQLRLSVVDKRTNNRNPNRQAMAFLIMLVSWTI